MNLKMQLTQCSQCSGTNRVQRQSYWRLNTNRGKEGLKEGSQMVPYLSTPNTQAAERGDHSSLTSCRGLFMALQAFPTVSATPRGSKLENLENLT